MYIIIVCTAVCDIQHKQASAIVAREDAVISTLIVGVQKVNVIASSLIA